MGTGSLKNKLQRRVEIATAARGPRNGDHTVAQRLAQGLDTGIEHHTIITTRILDTSQDCIGAGGYRIRYLKQRTSIGISQHDAQKYATLSGRRGRTTRGSFGFSVGVEPGDQ